MISLDLNDKVAVVTGVTSGIGAGIASMMAKAGSHVSGCGKSESKSAGAETFINSVQREGKEALYVSADVRKEEDIKHLVQSTIEKFGKMDIVISNAGLNVFKGAMECTTEEFDFNTELNLRSHWFLAKQAQPYLKKSDNALIVIMTSNHAYSTIPGSFPYNVTKAGLVGLVNALAVEWGPEIRTIGLAPGFIQTEGGKKWFEHFDDPESAYLKTVELHPVKRLGDVDELGAFCVFLATGYARFITGTTYLIDGGRSALMIDETE
ncbi:MAG: SDR family NAD(P)-dependent oxidoreductase [Bacteroidota bacterium]